MNNKIDTPTNCLKPMNNKQQLSKKSEIVINFGALADSVESQMRKQGYILSKEEAKKYQQLADAITILHVYSLIPDSTIVKARQKLMRKIAGE